MYTVHSNSNYPWILSKISSENFITVNFIAVKSDGSYVIAEICLHENLFTDSRYDVTSVNFNSKNVYEDEIFCRKMTKNKRVYNFLHITIFLRRIQRLQVFKIPTDVILLKD